MISKKRTLFLVLLIFTGGLGYVGYQFLNPGQRDISKEKADYQLSIEDLYEGFNAEGGNAYIDKVIQTSGRVTEVERNSVILNHKVQVNFMEHNSQRVESGAFISIKGRCVGFDDLLELVKMDQATLTHEELK